MTHLPTGADVVDAADSGSPSPPGAPPAGRRWPTGAGLPVPVALGLLLLAVALAAPLLAPYGPLDGSLRERLLAAGSPGHPLGTDGQGRDMLSRLLWGARPSLIGGFAPVCVAAALGTAAGVTAGLGGRFTEQALLRALDVLYAFPGILMALAVATVLHTGLGAVVISLSVVLTPAVTRVVFTEVRRVRTAEYLEAARVSGAGRFAVAVRQVVPVVAPVVLVYCSSLVGLSIVYAAGLSFLGLGVTPPHAEWGAMLQELWPSLLTHPGVAVLPALVILAVSVLFNCLGEALRRRVGDSLDPAEVTR
jgi:peptide/nickel transport system permease protein